MDASQTDKQPTTFAGSVLRSLCTVTFIVLLDAVVSAIANQIIGEGKIPVYESPSTGLAALVILHSMLWRRGPIRIQD